MFNLDAITGRSAASFDPAKEVPPLTGKVILVTGAAAGIGKQVAAYLAGHRPAEIWLADKHLDKAEAACLEIGEAVAGKVKLRALRLDLGSLESVREAAAAFRAAADRLDVLMLNAGVMGVPPGLTADGYELHFGINHLGHAYLAKLLLPLLNKTVDVATDVRVIITTSYSHWNAPEGGILFDVLETPAASVPSLKRYAQSKLAGILLARRLAEQNPRLLVASVHPGAADTDLHAAATDVGLLDRLVNRLVYPLLIFQSVGTVAKNLVWAATAPTKDLVSGEYYEPLGRVAEGRPEGRDAALAQRLWDWTEEQLRDLPALEGYETQMQ